ncbi:MAG: alpha/beta hydrolase [Acidimicrobiia bacterium]|nr:alpha/beta hydrolase [Acidimicrobiia bacterium]
MRRDVSFKSKGLTCRGWLYEPSALTEGTTAPAIVMAHGFSGVKELDLGRFAEPFAEAGFVTLVFDYRYLGESDGEPRAQVLFREQQEDYRNAITWLSQQPVVDAARIGVWGTSYSGGHVLYLSAFDRRIKAAVAQVPAIGTWRSLVAQHGVEALRMMLALTTADREARYPHDEPTYMPVVAPPGQPAVLGTPDAYDWFVAGATEQAPTWRNEVTIESVEQLVEYDPAAAIELISPTPLLMVAAENDTLIPLASVREVFERAGEPKALKTVPCGHFDVYHDEPYHSDVLTAELEWFKEHLAG